ncbi:MAG: hypothetical protein LC122_09600 [Chitinophagales bacterium]|nr:hypothetical protein [Chitinophagales bacterium]
MKSIVLFFLFFCLFISCNKNNSEENNTAIKTPPPAIIQDTTIKDIKFSAVVDRGTFKFTLTNGRSGLSTVKYIVVDKKSTQDEVKKLANKLWYQYQSSDMITIPILTSLKAAQNYDNFDYDLSDSWLLLICKDYKQNEIQYQPAFDKLQTK